MREQIGGVYGLPNGMVAGGHWTIARLSLYDIDTGHGFRRRWTQGRRTDLHHIKQICSSVLSVESLETIMSGNSGKR